MLNFIIPSKDIDIEIPHGQFFVKKMINMRFYVKNKFIYDKSDLNISDKIWLLSVDALLMPTLTKQILFQTTIS